MDLGEVIKQRRFKTDWQKAQINLIYTYNWLRDQHAPIFKSYGILEQHYNVLRIINGAYPAPCFPSDILEVMLDKKRDLTRLVDKLVRLELVQRQVCEENRRKVEIHITEKGQSITENIARDLDQLEQKIRHLSEYEAKQLSDLLDKMRG